MPTTYCPVCGADKRTCNTPSHSGGGLTVTRLNRDAGDKIMEKPSAEITISKHRYYVTKDKTRAVKAGDPEADTLLVGKGGAVLPEVAEHYGLETEIGLSIAKVEPNAAQVRAAMVTEGTTRTADNYDRMALQNRVMQETGASVKNPHNSGGSMQASIMAAGVVNEAFGMRDAHTGKPLDEKAERRIEEQRNASGQAPSTGADFSAETMRENEPQNRRTKEIGGRSKSGGGTAETETDAQGAGKGENGETASPVTGEAANEFEQSLKDALNEEDLKEGALAAVDKSTLNEKARELEKDLNNPDKQRAAAESIKPPAVS